MQNFQPVRDEDLLRELFSRDHSLHDFVKYSWNIIDPAIYIDNWHVGFICEHLEAIFLGQIKNALINIPPRMLKSTIVSVCFPSWVWIRKPEHKFMCSTYADSLSLRDAIKMRDLVTSPWFKNIYPDLIEMKSDQDTKNKFENIKGGYRLSTSVYGMATGEGGDTLLIDDPHDARDIYSETKRQFVIDWYKTKMRTRLNDPKTGSKIIIMQRLHDKDLSGWILEESEEKFEHICLPMEYVPTVHVTTIGKKDPRKVEGELLFPERYGETERDLDRKDMGSLGYAGQMQQSPTPAKGNIVKTDFLKYFREKDFQNDPQYDDQGSFFDLAFEGDKDQQKKTQPDFNAGAWVTRLGNNFYFHSWMHLRAAFPEAQTAIENFHSKLTTIPGITIERKANGHAMIQTLKKKQYKGVVGYEPVQSKEARLYDVLPMFEAGQVHFNQDDPKTTEAIKELTMFPKAANDDYVDVITMALLILRNRSTKVQRFAGVGKRKYG